MVSIEIFNVLMANYPDYSTTLIAPCWSLDFKLSVQNLKFSQYYTDCHRLTILLLILPAHLWV